MSQSQGDRLIRPFFRVVSTEQARAHLAQLRALASETIDVADAAGRVLARDVVAREDLPHFNRANMDGYAVRARDTFGASGSAPAYLKIAGTIAMGQPARRALDAGQAMRIATGGMVPEGADAVVMVEHTDELDDGVLEVHRAVSPWQHVLRSGEDVAAGDHVLAGRRRLHARDLGALAGLGVRRVRVYRKPRVGLIATGDEIVAPDKRPRPGQVRNINQPSLLAMARDLGCEAKDYGVVPDDAALLRAALQDALAAEDVVFLSGGSSVGTKDLTTDVIRSLPRSEIVFHGISVAPGKPTILARAMGKVVFGLPGHPVSALVIFDLFGAPLLRMLEGEPRESAFRPLRSTRAVLAQNVASQPGREDYVRVRLGERDGRLEARPIPGKSGAIFHLISADGLVCVPANVEGLDEGAEVDVLRF